MAAAETAPMGTGRLEACSDGVFAIVVTLLVLDIRVPAPGHGGSLGHELLAQCPGNRSRLRLPPPITIALCGLTAIYYALPIASRADRGHSAAKTA